MSLLNKFSPPPFPETYPEQFKALCQTLLELNNAPVDPEEADKAASDAIYTLCAFSGTDPHEAIWRCQRIIPQISSIPTLMQMYGSGLEYTEHQIGPDDPGLQMTITLSVAATLRVRNMCVDKTLYPE